MNFIKTVIEKSNINNTYSCFNKDIKKLINVYFSYLFPGYYSFKHSKKTTLEDLENIFNKLMWYTENDKKKIDVLFSKISKELPKIKDLIFSDIVAAYKGDPALTNINDVILCYPCFKAISAQRFAHLLYSLKIETIPRAITELQHQKTGIDINPGAKIGEGFFIDHGTGVVIGETTVIGNNVTLYQNVTLGAKSFPQNEDGTLVKGIKRHPNIEDNVVIYAGATILGDITIGKNSIIGGNTWITNSVPENSKIVI